MKVSVFFFLRQQQNEKGIKKWELLLLFSQWASTMSEGVAECKKRAAM
jgi:hypothetical protein